MKKIIQGSLLGCAVSWAHLSPGSLQIQAPAVLDSGSRIQIQWKVSIAHHVWHDLHYSTDQGLSWQFIDSVQENSLNLSYQWTLPKLQGATLQIRAYQRFSSGPADQEDSYTLFSQPLAIGAYTPVILNSYAKAYGPTTDLKLSGLIPGNSYQLINTQGRVVHQFQALQSQIELGNLPWSKYWLQGD